MMISPTNQDPNKDLDFLLSFKPVPSRDEERRLKALNAGLYTSYYSTGVLAIAALRYLTNNIYVRGGGEGVLIGMALYGNPKNSSAMTTAAMEARDFHIHPRKSLIKNFGKGLKIGLIDENIVKKTGWLGLMIAGGVFFEKVYPNLPEVVLKRTEPWFEKRLKNKQAGNPPKPPGT